MRRRSGSGGVQIGCATGSLRAQQVAPRRPRRRSDSCSRRCAAATPRAAARTPPAAGTRPAAGLAWCTAWKLLLRNRIDSGPRSSMITLRAAGPLVRLMLEEGADAQDRRAPASSRGDTARPASSPTSASHSRHRHDARQVQRPGPRHRPVAGAQPPRGRRARAGPSRRTARSPCARAACCSRRASARTGRRSRAQTAGSR